MMVSKVHIWRLILLSTLGLMMGGMRRLGRMRFWLKP